MINGIQITPNPHLPATRYEQFRFPRSKRSRIRKKWRKRLANWRNVDCTSDVHVILGQHFIHPDGYQRLKVFFGLKETA